MIRTAVSECEDGGEIDERGKESNKGRSIEIHRKSRSDVDVSRTDRRMNDEDTYKEMRFMKSKNVNTPKARRPAEKKGISAKSSSTYKQMQ